MASSISILPLLPLSQFPFSSFHPKFHYPYSSSSSSSCCSYTTISHSKLKPHNYKVSFPLQNYLPTPQLPSLITNHTHLPTTISSNAHFDSNPQILHQKCLHLLKLSTHYGDVELTRAVHSLILKLEDGDNYLSNSLITAYLKMGLFSYAYDTFRGVLSPDVVSYTAMISGFAKMGFEVESVRFFVRMGMEGISPNEFSFVALLTACNRMEDVGLGLQVHGLVVKLGFVVDKFVANALMGMYVKCRSLEAALKVFDEMSERDIASWNTVMAGVVNNGGMFEKGLELFNEMKRIDGFRVDHFTLSTLLDACVGCCAWKLGREVHGHAIRVGLERNLSVNNALIGFYTKCGGGARNVEALFERMPVKDVVSWTGMITAYMEFGMVDLAVEVFKKMPERNAVSFNAVLAGLCRNGKGFEALSLFQKMVSNRVEMTEYTLTSAISACSLVKEKKLSEQIHGFVLKFGVGSSNSVIDAALIDMCTRCGRMEDAQVLVSQSDYDVNHSINLTSLICGHARNAQPEEAISLFQWGLTKADTAIDEVVLTAVLGVCGTLGFHEFGKQMHCHALKLGFLHDPGVGNAVISAYSKCGSTEDAVRAFELLPLSTRDVGAWNSLISGYLLQRQGNKALAIWSRMKRESINPNSATLHWVISSYRHTELSMLDDCQTLFFSMKELYDIEPTSDHYASFVSVLGHWGAIEEAEGIITNIPFDPIPSSIWQALLHSCRSHSDLEAQKRIAKGVLSSQPQDPSTFILISNLYSASGRWHCAEMVREKMKSEGFQKHPARSWMIHQHEVHSFYTRDRSHPRSKDIYSGLKVLIIECLKAGYEPDTSFVLHEVEEHQKKDFLFYHSAKLAVTYGLLNTRKPKPIRVMKSVVLCGDCHNFLKYVSKVTKREIYVRDNSGFHQFCDGKCSCKDLW